MRKKKMLLLLLGIGIFFLFVFFSYLVHENIFTKLDFDTTVRLQDNIPRKLDTTFSVLSLIGEFQFMLILLVVFLIIARKILLGIAAFGAFGLFHLIELYGKFFVEHKPPPHFMLRTEKIGDFPQFYVSTENSYPSGHAGRAIFITILIGFFIWRSKKIPPMVKLIIFAILVGYDIAMLVSRAYLGEHWATDVIGGALLAAALALLSGALVF